jgi:hypothetical protein
MPETVARVKAIILLFTLLCFFPAAAWAQTIRGKIVEDSTRMPIAGAAVELVGANVTRPITTLSDSAGVFVVRATTAGRYVLQLTHPSYSTVRSDTVALNRGEVILVQLRMGRQAIPLEPLVVTSRGNARHGGFYDRMNRGGFGHYITRTDIDNRPGAGRTTDLLQGVAGVELIPIRRGRGSSTANIIAMRGAGLRCPPAIYINGAPVRQIGESGVDDLLSPNILEAIEVYRSSAGTPPQFQQPGTCGAVAFWTRQGGEEEFAKFNWKRVGIAAGVGAVMLLLASFITK